MKEVNDRNFCRKTQGTKVSQLAHKFQGKSEMYDINRVCNLQCTSKEMKDDNKILTNVSIVRTDSHLERFHNARAVFEKMEEKNKYKTPNILINKLKTASDQKGAKTCVKSQSDNNILLLQAKPNFQNYASNDTPLLTGKNKTVHDDSKILSVNKKSGYENSVCEPNMNYNDKMKINSKYIFKEAENFSNNIHKSNYEEQKSTHNSVYSLTRHSINKDLIEKQKNWINNFTHNNSTCLNYQTKINDDSNILNNNHELEVENHNYLNNIATLSSEVGELQHHLYPQNFQCHEPKTHFVEKESLLIRQIKPTKPEKPSFLKMHLLSEDSLIDASTRVITDVAPFNVTSSIISPDCPSIEDNDEFANMTAENLFVKPKTLNAKVVQNNDRKFDVCKTKIDDIQDSYIDTSSIISEKSVNQNCQVEIPNVINEYLNNHSEEINVANNTQVKNENYLDFINSEINHKECSQISYNLDVEHKTKFDNKDSDLFFTMNLCLNFCQHIFNRPYFDCCLKFENTDKNLNWSDSNYGILSEHEKNIEKLYFDLLRLKYKMETVDENRACIYENDFLQFFKDYFDTKFYLSKKSQNELDLYIANEFVFVPLYSCTNRNFSDLQNELTELTLQETLNSLNNSFLSHMDIQNIKCDNIHVNSLQTNNEDFTSKHNEDLIQFDSTDSVSLLDGNNFSLLHNSITKEDKMVIARNDIEDESNIIEYDETVTSAEGLTSEDYIYSLNLNEASFKLLETLVDDKDKTRKDIEAIEDFQIGNIGDNSNIVKDKINKANQRNVSVHGSDESADFEDIPEASSPLSILVINNNELSPEFASFNQIKASITSLSNDDNENSFLSFNLLENIENDIMEPEKLHFFHDGHFWMEIPGIPESDEDDLPHYIKIKTKSKVKFCQEPIKVYTTYSIQEYDRKNDEIDPVAASAEYELEKRIEKMEIFPVSIYKGADGLGLKIIGMGVGADAGLEKLGIFVKSVTLNGAAYQDGRIQINDQILEVDGKSLVGVTQAYAASVLRNTSGVVQFIIGRERDNQNSEVAQLIKQSIEADKAREENKTSLDCLVSDYLTRKDLSSSEAYNIDYNAMVQKSVNNENIHILKKQLKEMLEKVESISGELKELKHLRVDHEILLEKYNNIKVMEEQFYNNEKIYLEKITKLEQQCQEKDMFFQNIMEFLKLKHLSIDEMVDFKSADLLDVSQQKIKCELIHQGGLAGRKLPSVLKKKSISEKQK